MVNLDMPLDDIIKQNKESSRGRGRGRGRGRSRGRGRGRGNSSSGGTRSAPLSSFADTGRSAGTRTETSLRPKRPSAAQVAKSFISRRSGGWRGRDLFEDAVGALGIETGTKLFISNLESGVSNEDIRELFSEMGTLKHCGVHYDRSGRSIGSADVVFLRRPDAIAAMKRYNNVRLDGKPMKVDLIGTNVLPPPPRAPYVSTSSRRGSQSSSRGRGRGRGSGFRRQGRGRGQRAPSESKNNVTAESLDADLEKYHQDAMEA